MVGDSQTLHVYCLKTIKRIGLTDSEDIKTIGGSTHAL